ncbi:MAG: T9SS type A sorting domain-containing protein [Bacteroidales bacterium]|nr:T9SS type A sorting domain-containing protein [Bacteroidales bacterium]MCF8455054.1 T9SS type A sorting domain-containing protein [Bacteroidales bacterium]
MLRLLSIIGIIFCLNISVSSQWNLIQDADDPFFYYKGVYFINDSVGYVAGNVEYDVPVDDSLHYGIILKTVNGGQTWDTLKFPMLTQINCIQFVTSDIGYAAGAAYEFNILKTIDGGNSWQYVPLSIPNVSSLGFSFNDIHFLNKDTGFLSSDWPYFLVKTEDGGLSWSAILMPVDLIHGYPKAYTMHFRDSFGVTSTLWKTQDNGATWYHDPDPFPPISGPNILFFDPDNGISAGHFYFANVKGNLGAIAVTNNGGQTWTTEYYDNFDWLACIFSANNSDVYVSGRSSSYLFMKSPDKGNTWHYQQSYPSSILAQINDIHFPSTNKKVGYAVGSHIFKTTNGGGELIPLSVPENNISFSNDNLKLSPNPANNIISIKIEGDVLNTVGIYSSSGQLILKTESNKSQEQINISSLPLGNYFIRVLCRDEVFVRKFVVVR